MGTPSFAARVLADLIRYEEVAAVFTQPDAIKGRGGRRVPCEAKVVAEENGIPVFCPDSLSDRETIELLRGIAPDAIIVAAYGKILPEVVIKLPPLGCLNVHASLLPRWRGAAPIERAILAGDEYVGTSIMKMEAGLDTGSYCHQRRYEASGKGLESLMAEMTADIGAQLHEVLENERRSLGNIWHEQDGTLATYAEKLGKRELYVSDDDTAEDIVRKVLSSSSSRSAKVDIAGKTVSILKAVVLDDASLPIAPNDARVCEKRLLLSTVDGTVEVLELKPDGKNAMSAKAFAAGVPELKKSGSVWSPTA